MKQFHDELIKFYNKLIGGEKFAFSKYADGEWAAINRVKMTNGEWVMYDADNTYEESRQLLVNSIQFKDPGYYVGVSCPCCQGQQIHRTMKWFSGQDEDHLTYANLFVNSNYKHFLELFIPEFAKRDIVLVANENSVISKLPFKAEYFYPISYNAWVKDLDTLELLKQQDFLNKTFLFSCGPFGNILAHQLWNCNKSNVYLDIGSTLDHWLNNDAGNKRCYHMGMSGFSDKVCVWS